MSAIFKVFGNLMECRLPSICAVGRGRMAAMERLLATGSAMEPSPEEASHEKLAAQTIHKEMNEADVPNLLDAEEMDVFELQPLADPLHLVSCNGCKKPIKASQYAAHAERCRSLNASDDTGLELDGGTGHKKPPRKARKKIQTAHDNQAVAMGEQEISESLDGDDTAASESANVDDGQTGIASSLGREVKRSSTSVDGSLTVDGPGIGPASASYSEGAMSPSKRAKLMPIQSSLTSEELDIMCGVTTESGMCCQGPLTCKLHSETSKRAIIGRKQCYDILLEEQKAKLVHGHESRSKGDHCSEIPVPLATKIYYPRQTQRLRTVLGHLYRESLTRETSNDASSPRSLAGDNAVQSATMPILSPDNALSDQQKEFLNQKKKESSTAPLLRKSEHMLPPSSEVSQGVSGGHPSHITFQNQYHENNFPRTSLSLEAGPAGIMRSRFLQTPYSFPRTTGSSMGSMQQPNGVVPVI